MIVTFYSYKGGSGRTLALANIAVLLAQRGQRVLAVDFDLEAPGLMNYLRPIAAGEARDGPGLLDMFTEVSNDRSPDWRDYVVELQRFRGRGSLSVMPSGRPDQDYPRRVLRFDWDDMFAAHHGGEFLDRMREEWLKAYEFVLLDSRTGITDIGGICTIHLPDVIIAVFTASDQSVEGVLDVLERAHQGRQRTATDRPRLGVVPLPSRIEVQTELRLRKSWQERFAQDFAPYMEPWLPKSLSADRILERITLPYIPFYSYGEPLPVMVESITAPGSLAFALDGVAQLLEGGLVRAADLFTSDRGESSTAKTPVVMRSVPPRNRNFVGRREAMQQLFATLELQTAESRRATVLGLGGVGKTQLAIEYVYRNSSLYDLIFWITATDEASIRRSFGSLASVLDVPASENDEDAIDRVLDALRVGHRFESWLLIFDSAGDPGMVRRYLPSGPGGRTLVTSRDTTWRSTDSNASELWVFSAAESREYLVEQWPGIDVVEADELAALLGHLPLALALAATFHSETGVTVAEFLRETEPLFRFVTDGESSEYPESVRKSWLRAFGELTIGAQQLLHVCCFLGSEPIHATLLRSGGAADLSAPLNLVLRDNIQFRQALRALSTSGLVQFDTTRDMLIVHTLVRSVLIRQLSSDDTATYRRLAQEIIGLANPGHPDRFDNWPQLARIRAHVVAADIVSSDEAYVRRALLDQIGFLFAIGDFRASAQLANHAVQGWSERHGRHDEMALQSRVYRANALRRLGEHEEATTESEEVRATSAEYFGTLHELTLAATLDTAAGRRAAGNFHGAYAIDRDVLDAVRRKGHGDLLSARAAQGLAVDLRLLGRYREALEVDESSLADLNRRGDRKSDPDTLQSFNGVIFDLIQVGDFKRATIRYDELIGPLAAGLPDHPLLLIAHRNNAVLHRKLGDLPQALALSEILERRAVTLVGPEHEIALAAAMTLVNALAADAPSGSLGAFAGQLNRAIAIAEASRAAYVARFGPRHPITLACEMNVASIYRRVGREAEAYALTEATLAEMCEQLGRTHPYSLMCQVNFASDIAVSGDAERAAQVSESAHDGIREQFGETHPVTCEALANLVIDLEAMGSSRAWSARARTEAINGLRESLGREHPETINVERHRRTTLDIDVALL